MNSDIPYSFTQRCEHKLNSMHEMLRLIARKSQNEELVHMCEIVEHIADSLKADLEDKTILPGVYLSGQAEQQRHQ